MIGRTFHVGDIVALLRDNIMVYNPLLLWCNDTFSKDLRLVIGADERNEQGQAEAPFVVIVPDLDTTGITNPELSSTFTLEVGVWNETFSDYQDNNVIEMQGLYQVIEMANHVVNCIRGMAEDHELFVDEISLEYNSGVFFPLHIGTMTGTVHTDHLLGGVQQTLGA